MKRLSKERLDMTQKLIDDLGVDMAAKEMVVTRETIRRYARQRKRERKSSKKKKTLRSLTITSCARYANDIPTLN